MSLEAAYIESATALRRRIERMTGDRETAEDLTQEAFARAWTAAPRDAGPVVLRRWLYSTAGNLAVDELRRRSRRGHQPFDETEPAFAMDERDSGVAREALGELTPHERFVLLLRFHAGLSLGELAALLDVTPEAARKRVARARESFRLAYASHHSDPAPLVMVLVRDDDPDTYVSWLEEAGARVNVVTEPVEPRDLLAAEAVVISGATSDIHPGTYGERARVELHGSPDRRRDLRDLAAMRAALASDLPIIGICRGHQLMNVLSGGRLFQDLAESHARPEHSAGERHDVRTAGDSAVRGMIGRDASVDSLHHQGIRTLGHHLRVAAMSPDGVVESVERTDRRFAVGVQWHPQRNPDDHGNRQIAEALVKEAIARRTG